MTKNQINSIIFKQLLLKTKEYFLYNEEVMVLHLL